ncbi:MAG TPA: restriction endonuclease [Caldisericia bacterium]|nr:restriction endonuclease [Caldisericia bacterium]
MIPPFQEIMLPLLEFLKDGKEHSIDEAEDYLAKVFNLTDEERHKLLKSGNQTVFRNRVGWAKTYMYKAKLLDVPRRANIVITERGLEVLKENPQSLSAKYLMKFPEFVEFHKSNKKEKQEEPESPSKSPEEVIYEKTDEINNYVKSELIIKILKSSPHFFEKLVLNLIVKMGYGGSFEDVVELLGKTGDEGVDGLIKEDILGLDKVYLQAKRWTTGTVGRKELQSFVGALLGKGAKKGIFITTSTFTKDALEYANSLKNMTLILIDGDKLVDYMLEYNVGVQVKNTIEIKKIDEDYFEEF